MAKASGGTRASGPAPSMAAMTYEQQVDNALSGLKGEFFEKMDDFYNGQWERWQERYADFKEKDDYIYQGASSISATEADRREQEIYGKDFKPYNRHYERERKLRDDYSDLVAGGYYEKDAKAPSFYDIKKGRADIGDAEKAVRATSRRNAEKKFEQVRDKMMKTTLEKGLDTKNARVRSVGGDGFLITDGKVTLHARYVLAWGEIKAPHFRFIITDRKG